jgi:hypothetical protein
VIRLPRKAFDLRTAQRYCCGRAASARAHGKFVILELISENDDGYRDEQDDNESGWLSSLVPLRNDLIAGDLRAFYLAWLLCAQSGDLDDDAIEPPVPAGLGNLTAPLQALTDFLRIDAHLLAVAAARSSAIETSFSESDVKQWITALSESEKTGWLLRLVTGQEPHVRAELLRQIRESRPPQKSSSNQVPRTVQALLEEASRQATAEKIRREREAAEERTRYLDDLAKREALVWEQVDALVLTKQRSSYDEAASLLRDLRDLASRDGHDAIFEERILRIRKEHGRKVGLIERLQREGLLPPYR